MKLKIYGFFQKVKKKNVRTIKIFKTLILFEVRSVTLKMDSCVICYLTRKLYLYKSTHKCCMVSTTMLSTIIFSIFVVICKNGFSFRMDNITCLTTLFF